MGLQTRKEFERAVEGRESENAPLLPPLPAVERWRWRMHHPETSDRHPMRDFEFEVDAPDGSGGERVKVINGIALVRGELADLLERRDWRRGKRIESDFWED